MPSKLTPEQRQEIKANREGLSIKKLAAKYGVSRRTVQFLMYPERKERSDRHRIDRGGWQLYYLRKRRQLIAQRLPPRPTE